MYINETIQKKQYKQYQTQYIQKHIYQKTHTLQNKLKQPQYIIHNKWKPQ